MDATFFTTRVDWRMVQRGLWSFIAGYGVAEEVGSQGQTGDAPTRRLIVTYSHEHKTLNWNVTASINRQDSNVDFARKVETSSVQAGLTWRFHTSRGRS